MGTDVQQDEAEEYDDDGRGPAALAARRTADSGAYAQGRRGACGDPGGLRDRRAIAAAGLLSLAVTWWSSPIDKADETVIYLALTLLLAGLCTWRVRHPVS